MKKLLILFLIIISGKIHTQTYYPFVVQGAHWETAESYCPGCSNFDMTWSHNFNITYSIEGDTLIDTIYYAKLYASRTGEWYSANNVSHAVCEEKSFRGLLREDTSLRKVYFMGDLYSIGCVRHYDHDSLLYDFSLQVGDSTIIPITNAWGDCVDTLLYYVDSINNEGIYQWPRKTLWLSDHQQQITQMKSFKLVEGIGPEFGFTGGPQCTEECTFGASISRYCIGTDSTCNMKVKCLPLGIDEPYNPFISIYPNPVSEIINISSNIELETVRIYNAAGQLEFVGPYYQTIDVSALPSSIYVLVISNKSDLAYRTFVKH